MCLPRTKITHNSGKGSTGLGLGYLLQNWLRVQHGTRGLLLSKDLKRYGKPSDTILQLPGIELHLIGFEEVGGVSNAMMMESMLHALAWNAHFKTVREQMLWRSSVPIIMGFGPLVLLLYSVTIARTYFVGKQEQAKLEKACREAMERHRLPPLVRKLGTHYFVALQFRLLLSISSTWVFWFLLFCSCVAAAVLVVTDGLARVFIVVECLLALFHSEPGVFEEPNWSVYSPHIT